MTVQLHYRPDYILDEMKLYEILPIINNLYLGVKDGWEQARLIAWAALMPHQKNKTKLENFMEFWWEKAPVEEDYHSTASVEELKEQIKDMENLLNGGAEG